MLVRDVVRDDVDDGADAAVERRTDELLGVGERSEGGVDVAVVGDVVAAVAVGRRVARGQPDGVDSERDEMLDPRGDAVQVAEPVPVRVGEGLHVDLVDDGLAPPGVRPARGAHRDTLTDTRAGERMGPAPRPCVPRHGLPTAITGEPLSTMSIFVRDRDGWYLRLRLGPRLWFVLGRWEG